MYSVTSRITNTLNGNTFRFGICDTIKDIVVCKRTYGLNPIIESVN